MEKLKIKKRDGRTEKFETIKISNAIMKAASEIGFKLEDSVVLGITTRVMQTIEKKQKEEKINVIHVEDVQDIIESVLSKAPYKKDYAVLRTSYSDYRRERTILREMKSDIMTTIEKIAVETDVDNINLANNFSSKLLRIASEANRWQNLAHLPKNLAKRHENGDLYYHDLESYNLTLNSLHIPTRETLNKGFNVDYTYLGKPQRIETAAELSCLLLQLTQSDMFGSQSHANFDNDMGIFVRATREEIKDELIKDGLTGESLENRLEEKLRGRVQQAMQGVMYDLNTMNSRSGAKTPLSSINIGLPENKDAALVCEVFLIEYEKGLGRGGQAIFPNIIFRLKDGVNKKESDPYYYLYKLAARVASKRMNPTFMNLDADFNKEYYDKGYIPATMGCRSYIMSNVNGEPGVYGRGNIATTTINLPRIGLQAHGDVDKFFELLDERLKWVRESLEHRYKMLKRLTVKDLPFVVGQNIMKGSEGLGLDDSIEPILKQGTWAIGFIGLAETLIALKGSHHGEDKDARELGIKIVKYIRKYTDTLTRKTKLNWSTYAVPGEGVCGKFIVQDKKMFGEIKGVTDKDYYTNSFHIPVSCYVGINEKIEIEAPYHKICNGGHITSIELEGYPDEDSIMDIINYAFNETNLGYMSINFHIKYCVGCGEYLENHEFTCTSCGGTEIKGISRVSGYLALDERFNPAKSSERADRVSDDTGVLNYDCRK